MPKRTINEAIIAALELEGKPLRVQEIYKRVKEDDLYRFNAENPEHIVRTQLRRHSENLSFPTAHKTKHFLFLADGTYWIKGKKDISLSIPAPSSAIKSDSSFDSLKTLHEQYLAVFKKALLAKLFELDAFVFEQFCKKLLETYGFRDVVVTARSKDGGIDGHGELKIGLASLPVAFECKRYTTKLVDRRIVNQFRGDIQGKFQQGILFTTSDFNRGAKDVSFQSGAVPIVLINGLSIVEIMIEKEFGVEKELLPIYSDAIDLIFEEE
ncbi:restriction endonuclease [Flaviaesturariibacter aridisoli]|uniref:Restriction endonuclease n=1 Tax=Flaviaesturariibacter aridisoli TaxID=2545761 RepID=A0A4R4E7M2_9BACT|nr:restriction endonuclease [Flaviaesturariibacter aridisoli]TCZ74061.1 restriction endonuclease [Flaviaesturariibacter aridisoli]